MRYLLDTNIVSEMIRNPHGLVTVRPPSRTKLRKLVWRVAVTDRRPLAALSFSPRL